MKMKKLSMGLSIILLFLTSALLAETSRELKGPRLLIVDKSANLGDVKEGAVLEHTFKVQNPGDQPLRIEKVKPG
jgi:hypothetical protein